MTHGETYALVVDVPPQTHSKIFKQSDNEPQPTPDTYLSLSHSLLTMDTFIVAVLKGEPDVVRPAQI